MTVDSVTQCCVARFGVAALKKEKIVMILVGPCWIGQKILYLGGFGSISFVLVAKVA